MNTAPLAGAADVATLACSIHSGENGVEADEVIRLHGEQHAYPDGWTWQKKLREANGPGNTFTGAELQNMATVNAAKGRVVIQSKGSDAGGRGLDPTAVTHIAAAIQNAQNTYGLQFGGILLGNECDLDRLLGQPLSYWEGLGRFPTQVERAEYWASRIAPLLEGIDAEDPDFPLWACAVSTPTRLEGYIKTLVANEPTAAALVDAVTFHNYQSDPALFNTFDVKGRALDALGRTVPVILDETAHSFVSFPARNNAGDQLYRKPTELYVTHTLATFIESLRAGFDRFHDFNLCDAAIQADSQTIDQGQGYFRYDGTKRPAYASHEIMSVLSLRRAVAHEVTLSETRPLHFHAMGFKAGGRRGILVVRCETDPDKTATAYRNYSLRDLEPLSEIDPQVEAEAVQLEADLTATLGLVQKCDLSDLGARPLLAGSYGTVELRGNTLSLRGSAAALVVER